MADATATLETIAADKLLFDLDGTLVDSTPAVIKHWNAIGQEIGVDPAVIMRSAHGMRTIDTLKMFCPERANWDYVKKIEALIPVKYGEDATIIEGAKQLLDSIIEAKASWAIVTSGSRSLSSGWLARLGLPCPEILVSAESVAHGKPDPSCYKLALTELNAQLAPSMSVVLEDSPAGISAGKAAGCKVIGLVTSHSQEEIIHAGPDWVIKDLRSVKLVSMDQKSGMVTLQLSNIIR